MPRRLLYGLYAVLFIVSVALIVWQGSFSGSFGSFAPDDHETFVIYGVSTIILLVFVYLGFMLVRLIWKIWIERASDRPGSRIKTKLVAGALMLSVMPVFFMVFFSVYVLNNSMGKWFNRPNEHELVDFDKIAGALRRQTRDKANAEAELLTATPETRLLLAGGASDPSWLAQFCRARGIVAASISRSDGSLASDKPIAAFGQFPGPKESAITVKAPVVNQGWVRLAVSVP